MKSNVKHFVSFVIAILFYLQTLANGITITNVTVLPNTSQIQFDISWNNSWRSDVLQNWDAAWVFVKYRTTNVDFQNWLPVNFTGTGNVFPAGFTGDVVSDNKGVFIYRNTAGSGTSTITGVKLGIPSNFALGIYDLKVFGIEMVYIPTAPFWAGDNNTSANPFADAFSFFSVPANITGASTNIKDPLSGQSSTIVQAPFPTGYNNFYCMKYEISQGAYRDFLNTLTYLQQTARTANLPNSPIGTNALTNVAQGRPYIEIATSGNAGGNTTPAVYGCDANNNNIFNEPGDGEWVACNYLNWPDLAAYLAWAGLSPMTELQYEKICRGPVQPVSGEYPWGNTQVSNNVYTLSAAGFTNETVTNPSSNVLEGNASYSVTNASIPGPFRNGIFATAASNRISSGGSFYGVMDMAGNMWERVVTTATTQGRAFDGSNGGYAIISLGFAGQTNWPGGPSIDGTNPATGLIYRGGSSHFAASYMRVSDRSILETGTANTRFIDQGGRGVRNL